MFSFYLSVQAFGGLLNTIEQINFTLPAKSVKNKDLTEYKRTQKSEHITELSSLTGNEYLVNFKGLNRSLSKKPFETTEAIIEEWKKHQNSLGIVGNLPHQWIEMIPIFQRGEIIKAFYIDFKTAVKNFRKHQNPKTFSENLTTAFQKASIIKDNETITIERLGSGALGTGYQIKGVAGNSLCIKVFHDNNNANNIHGNYAEINRAAFWQRNVGKNTQIVPFFFGDIDSGYMVTKFIGKYSKINEKSSYPELLGVRFIDVDKKLSGHNKLRGYQIDFGGMKIVWEFSKKVKKIISSFLKTSKKQKTNIIINATEEVKIALAWNIKNLNRKGRSHYYRLLAKNATDDIKIALIQNLDCLPKKERSTYFKQLAENASDKVKIVLASNLDCLPKKEISTHFKILAETSTDDIKIELVKKLHLLPKEEMSSCFKLLAKNTTDEVKIAFARKLHLLPREEIITHFDMLAENATDKVKIALANNLGYLPKEKRSKYFKLLAENATNDVKMAFARKVDCLPEGEILSYFKLLAENASDDVKIELAWNLDALPKEERLTYFKQFAENATDKVKENLAENIYLLPKNQRSQYFKQFAENATDDVKKVLIKNLEYLPEDERSQYFKQFAENATDDVKKVLVQYLDCIPEDQIRACAKLFKNK